MKKHLVKMALFFAVYFNTQTAFSQFPRTREVALRGIITL